MDRAITEFTNFLRGIPLTYRLLAIAVFALIICWGIVGFIKKSVGGGKVKWVGFAFSIISLACIILLVVFK